MRLGQRLHLHTLDTGLWLPVWTRNDCFIECDFSQRLFVVARMNRVSLPRSVNFEQGLQGMRATDSVYPCPDGTWGLCDGLGLRAIESLADLASVGHFRTVGAKRFECGLGLALLGSDTQGKTSAVDSPVVSVEIRIEN